jgi:hypothetical protein
VVNPGKGRGLSDPFHKTGLRSYTLRRWAVNEGNYGFA